MPFEIVKNDICNMQVDAIVNAANPQTFTDHSINYGLLQRARKQLFNFRKKNSNLTYGDAVITRTYKSNSRYVVYTAPPLWQDGEHNEEALLKQCYHKSLSLALKHRCKSIAFPLLPSENNTFPKELAFRIAINTFSQFMLNHEIQIYLVTSDYPCNFLPKTLKDSLQKYIAEHYTPENDYFSFPFVSLVNVPYKEDPLLRELEYLMDELDETFSEALIRLIDQKGLKDSDVYNKVEIDRRHFNKIKNNKNYKPRKTTCLALAFALELNIDETRDFIGTAGYALTRSNKFDIIIEYFINECNYNLGALNKALVAFNQPIIGE